MIVRELVASLGFKVNEEGLKKFELGIKNIKQNMTALKADVLFLGEIIQTPLKKMSIAAAAAIGTTNALAVSVAKTVKESSSLAESLGVSNEALKTLELLSQNSGHKVNVLTKSLVEFSKQVGTAKLSSTYYNTSLSRDFELLRLSAKDSNGNFKDTVSLYIEAAQKINNLTDATKKAAVAQRLFGAEGLLLVKTIGTSNKELQTQIDEIRKYAYFVDSKGIESSNKLVKTWGNFKLVLESIRLQIGVKLTPVMNKLLETFNNFYAQNKLLISNNIDGFVRSLSSAFNIFSNIVKGVIYPLKIVVESFGGLDNLIRFGLSVSFALLTPKILSSAAAIGRLSKAILANPISWFIGLIGVAVEDLWGFANGTESVLENIFGSWDNFKNKITPIISSMLSYIDSAVSKVSKFFNTVDTVDRKKESKPLKIVSIDENGNRRIIQTPDSKKINNNKVENLNILNDRNAFKMDLSKAEEDVNNNKINIRNSNNIKSIPQNVTEIKSNNDGNNIKKMIPLKVPTNNINNTSNNVTVKQEINNNIEIVVPDGTSEEQAFFLQDVLQEEIKKQFDTEINKTFDAIPLN